MSVLESPFFEIGPDIRKKEEHQIGETHLDGETLDQEYQACCQHAQIDGVADIPV